MKVAVIEMAGSQEHEVGDEEKVQSETRQDAISTQERDSEKGLGHTHSGDGQHAHIDPAIASRIAANVDDFMVSSPMQTIPVGTCSVRKED